MPFGRYSQHDKLATEALDDDGDVELHQHVIKSNILTYIGQQNVPMFMFKDIDGIIDRVYSDNYSAINAIINLKKFNLTIDARGLTVIQPATRKHVAKAILTYKLSDILYVTAHLKHEKVFSIVLRSSASIAVVYVYLCPCEDNAKQLLEQCKEEFENVSTIKEIKVNHFPDSIEIIHNNRMMHTQQEFAVGDEFVEKPNSLVLPNQGTSNGNSEEQHSAFTSPKHYPASHSKSSKNFLNKDKNIGYGELRNDSLDDEFSKLALKRNKNQPDHLQDKSFESLLLMQENDEDENTTKSSLFSSYARI